MSATTYYILKTVHVGCAAISYALFFTRGVWLLSGSERLHRRWVRIVPHTVDSLLLASALGLVWITGQYPGAQTWLNIKIAALVLYILLGMAAFRWCQSYTTKLAAWIVAQLVFFYIVAVALFRFH